MSYALPDKIRSEICGLVRPPRRMPVSEAAEKYVRIGKVGTSAPWTADVTPYLVEPMDCLSSRDYSTVCFVGPARTGKTQALVDCWIGFAAICDPGDMMVVHTSQDQARDYSILRVDRLFRNSPLLAPLLIPGQGDNTFDKRLRNGMVLKIGWPTISQLSSKDMRYMAITDYDRGKEMVGGEGPKYILAQKRTETFMSAGMTLLESSPGYDWLDHSWERSTAHELPAAPGIVSIYNQGDRRAWYWQCPECVQWFIPTFDLLNTEPVSDLVARAKSVRLACPHCACLIPHKDKREMNSGGRWIKEGESIDANGEKSGDGRQSKIASFHMSGVAAAYQTWESLVYKRFQAEEDYARTGSEEKLRGTVLIDEGVPYKPRVVRKTNDLSELHRRSEPTLKRHVPAGVRFLVTAIDVQADRFVVQTTGYGVDRERWIIDRYSLRRSDRVNAGGEVEPCSPSAYLQDWNLLLPVISKRYPLADETGRFMPVTVTGCDSGGKAGVTSKAYDFYRQQIMPARLASLFALLKGDGNSKAPRIVQRWPDTSGRKDRDSGSAGDVPVYMLNSNMIKDTLAGDLSRSDVGPGYVHFPDWLGPWFYAEMMAEQRDTQKGWQQTAKRNEAWDLMCYADALTLALTPSIEQIDWARPPRWAAEWSQNPYIVAGNNGN